MLLRLDRLGLGVLFSSSDEKRYQKRQPQENPFVRERVSYVSSQRGWGICAFEAQMREPNEICLNPPAFGRSRTKAGGFVKFGCPSGELLRRSVAEWAKPLTDSGDLAGGGSGMRVNWGLSGC